MKKDINRYIPLAINAIDKYLRRNTDKASHYKIDKEFKGYISSLGASIIMSGLVPTLAVYSDKEKQNRLQVIEWLQQILQQFIVNGTKDNKEAGASLKRQLPKIEDSKDLLKYAVNLNANERLILTKEVMNVSVALKLAIRTFELSE